MDEILVWLSEIGLALQPRPPLPQNDHPLYRKLATPAEYERLFFFRLFWRWNGARSAHVDVSRCTIWLKRVM